MKLSKQRIEVREDTQFTEKPEPPSGEVFNGSSICGRCHLPLMPVCADLPTGLCLRKGTAEIQMVKRGMKKEKQKEPVRPRQLKELGIEAKEKLKKIVG